MTDLATPVAVYESVYESGISSDFGDLVDLQALLSGSKSVTEALSLKRASCGTVFALERNIEELSKSRALLLAQRADAVKLQLPSAFIGQLTLAITRTNFIQSSMQGLQATLGRRETLYQASMSPPISARVYLGRDWADGDKTRELVGITNSPIKIGKVVPKIECTFDPKTLTLKCPPSLPFDPKDSFMDGWNLYINNSSRLFLRVRTSREETCDVFRLSNESPIMISFKYERNDQINRSITVNYVIGYNQPLSFPTPKADSERFAGALNAQFDLQVKGLLSDMYGGKKTFLASDTFLGKFLGNGDLNSLRAALKSLTINGVGADLNQIVSFFLSDSAHFDLEDTDEVFVQLWPGQNQSIGFAIIGDRVVVTSITLGGSRIF